MVDIELIETLDIFKSLTAEELEKILDLCVISDYQLGEKLFCEGDRATEMWIVVDGGVELRFEMPNMKTVTHDTTLTSHHKSIPESQVFGWSCFIEPYKMKLSAYCTSRRCRICKIDAQRLNLLMEEDTSIGFKIMRYIVQVVGYRFGQMKEETAKFMSIKMMNSW